MAPATYIDQWGNVFTPDQVSIEAIMAHIAAAPGGDGSDLIPFVVGLLIPVGYAIVCLCMGYYEED